MPTDESADRRAALIARLLTGSADLPTSALRRLGRTAWAGLRGRKVFASGEDADRMDPEEIARLVTSLGQLKGVSMKMGQLLSYIDLALPQEVREALGVLRTHAQPMPFETVADVVADELPETGPALLEAMDREPVAAASIGQVHRSRLPDGPPLAVKVQYPGIEEAIRNDFQAARIGPALAGLIYPGADIQGFIEEARARLLEECDYEHEARMQTRLRELHAGDPVLSIPEVHARFSSRRVLTSTFVDGLGFEAFLDADPPQAVRDAIGEALFGFYLGSLFEHGLFNADPHPGNYLFPAGVEEASIAVLDHGCVRRFEPAFVDELAQLSLAVHAEEDDRLRGILEEMAIIEPGDQAGFETARDLMQAFWAPMRTDGAERIELEEAIGMRTVFARKRELMRLDLPPGFLFLFRIRFGLVSVLSQLGAQANWGEIERGYAEDALR